MTFRFHEAAEPEIEAAIDFYERQQVGLGFRFFSEIEDALRLISENPLAWERMDEQTHRCLTNRFPYAVIYRVKSDHIRILAVMHLRRNPNCWKGR